MLKVNGNIPNLVPYEPGKTIEEIKREYGLTDIIKLASNENSFGASPKAVEAIKNIADKAYLYADGSCFQLREKIAEKLGLKVNNITVGNGSNEIIELMFRAFIDRGDNIISCFPTFSFYKICAQTTFGDFIEVPLANYTFSLDSILKKINANTKVVIICNPNNPTGTMVPYDKLENFISNLSDNILVVIDEAYIEFADTAQEDTVELIKKFPNKNILILRTFSKIFGLSMLRIGYGISKIEIADILNKVRQPFNVNGVAQAAAIAALEDDEFIRATLKGVAQGKNFLYNEFEKLGIFYIKSKTNFIFFSLNYDNNTVFKKFLENGIIIRSLKSFGYDTELRVTVGTPEQNEKFINALKNIL